MAIKNVAGSMTWTKVADDTDDPVSVQCLRPVEWEVAPMTADTDPAVAGFRLRGPDQIATRDNIGAGFVYVRLTKDAAATFVVNVDAVA